MVITTIAAGQALAGGGGISGGVSASTALSAAGLGLSGFGALSGASAAKAQGEAQAEIFRRQAEREQQIAALDAKRAREDAARLAGTQRAILGADGRDASTGSALLIQEDLAEEGEFNAKLIEAGGEDRASNRLAEATLARAAGRNKSREALFSFGTTLLTASKGFA